MGNKVTGLAVPLSIINVVNRLPTASATPSAAGAMGDKESSPKGRVISKRKVFEKYI
jgi:hypothetical protein